MGNYIDKFCGGTGTHEEFQYMPALKRDGEYQQYECKGWIWILKFDDKY